MTFRGAACRTPADCYINARLAQYKAHGQLSAVAPTSYSPLRVRQMPHSTGL